MAYWLSEPVESLLDAIACDEREGRCDALVVGSGYGGAIAALRLAEKGRRVILLERGKEYALGDFPENLGELPGHVRLTRPRDPRPLGNADALFDLRIGEGVSALVGSGLGGTSLINANVAIRPEQSTLEKSDWPKAIRDAAARLLQTMDDVGKLLGVTEDPERPRKYDALERLVRATGRACAPAPITVCFDGGKNAVGVEQSPCVRCGNCVTGCNVGAKNTLAMNLLPLAHARGARLYTGATVVSVEPEGAADGSAGWVVRVRRTAGLKGPLRDEPPCKLHARVVVLAAGALGSTEILLRSKGRSRLGFSARLGCRFSTNGDTLAFGYGQRRAVGAVATSGSLDPKPKNVGPTINGYARVPARKGPGAPEHELLLEDGAVPEPLARVFAELVTAGALAQRYVKDATPAWHQEHPGKDPLGVHPQALQHSQVLLGMGDDGAEGTLDLVPPEGQADSPDRDGWRFKLAWPKDDEKKKPAAFAFLEAVHECLKKAGAQGFDDGDYLQNPLWQMVPPEFARELSGKAPGGMLFTVHPLGGCPMGDEARTGVVNDHGRVFRADGALYDGLYVMDGAVVPRPLGVNPFLTIAALAWRSCDELLKELGWRESPVLRAAFEEPPRSRRLVPAKKEPVRVVLTERLTGNLGAARPPWFPPPAANENPVRDWLAAEISITISDLEAWLADPARPWRATCKLFANRAQSDGFVATHLTEVAAGEGRVRLLARDGPRDDDERQRRALAAILAYAQREGVKLDSERPFSERWRGLWRIACNHANWRKLEYAFTLHVPQDGRDWVLRGRKELAYHVARPNLWHALAELPVQLSPAGLGEARAETYRGVLKVDLVDLARRALMQARSAPHSPQLLMAMIGAGALTLRVLMQTHFWGFPAPDYASEAPPPRDPLPGTIRTRHSGRVAPERIEFEVPLSARNPKQLRLVLSRYPHPQGRRGEPVLLIHGLAHGANVFTTDTIRRPLASVLHDEGYEPWLLDHRLSPALAAARAQSTMDAIAQFDIAEAVRRVHAAAGGPIRVFAHCIGAGCFSMSVLRGFCHDEKAGRSMIKAAAIHAVPPWVVASPANRLRANLAAFVKDAIGEELVDPVPKPEQELSWIDTLIDRLAGSLPWPEEDLPAHNADRSHRGLGHAICNRMTLFYGLEWVHANLSPATHRRLAELVGVGNIETFRQVFFIAQRELLTDREGRNAYMTEERFRDYWRFPTLFSHGSRNGVFNPVSSERSAARLRRIWEQRGKLAEYPAYLQKVEGYGHMDFLFGGNAFRDVFPAICDFFDDARRARLAEGEASDPHPDPWPSPRCGPIIGHAQAAAGGRVQLRLWFELREDAAADVAQIAFTALGPGGAPDPGVIDEPLDRASCHPERQFKEYGDYGCYWVYQVSVPGDARTLCASVRYAGSPPRVPEKPPEAAARVPECAPGRDDPSQPAAIELDAPWFRRLAGLEARSGCTFLAGSCRHPGSPFEREYSDAVFGAMLAEVRRGADHVLLVGDQIYADATADAFDTREPGERYSARYRDAFRSPNMRRLLRSVPVYMAIDDHEIEDNWEGNPRPGEPRAERLEPATPDELYEVAREAALHYQRSMGPGWQPGREEHWYSFESGGLPFFVMDTRSERTRRGREVTPGAAVMIREAQRGEFEKWLERHGREERPKFVVCGTPLGPVQRDQAAKESLWRGSDTWFGYPATLRWLIETMARVAPRNVVFVSGDYHFSALASLAFYCDGRACAEAKQIIASGLYSPMPFANERLEDYTWDEWCAVPAVGSSARLGVKASLLAHGRSHFVRVRATPGERGWRIEAAAVDADGARFARATL